MISLNDAQLKTVMTVAVGRTATSRESYVLILRPELFALHMSAFETQSGLWSPQDICAATSHVRFTPNSDRESEIPQKVMSALTPKADMCSANRDVRIGPIADIGTLIRSAYQREAREPPEQCGSLPWPS
jgi:hypothetical protein